MSEHESDRFNQNISLYPQLLIDGISFLRICKADEVYHKKGKNIYFDEDVQIAVIREGVHVYAVSNICPHQYEAVICDGLVEEGTVTCPLHGWIYSLDSGKALGSNARLKTYTVLERDGYLWLEKPEKSTPLWLQNF
ncbi:Rieske (2Fe-2S) protein [bacterium]|nr:Rieske (2Fe-2S) protein [bacterium]